MAKGKYEYWLTPEGLLLLEGWARDGLTDEQISKEKMHISRSTLNEWKKKYPDISDTLKKGKEIVDREVENALLRKAKGYTVEVKKTFKVRIVDYDKKTGKKIREREELQTGIDEVHIPADTTAQIFWLKNRKPEAWRANGFVWTDDIDDGVEIINDAPGQDFGDSDR
ncbi:MAG: hypothetical protein IJX90_12190 [Blautia sp.]|nr:hypothetical protein [Blautia sp.]